MKNYKKIDWPIVVARLRKIGVSLDEIEKATGLSNSTIRKIGDERYDTKNFDKAVNLMLLYFDKTDYDIPVYGEHNE